MLVDHDYLRFVVGLGPGENGSAVEEVLLQLADVLHFAFEEFVEGIASYAKLAVFLPGFVHYLAKIVLLVLSELPRIRSNIAFALPIFVDVCELNFEGEVFLLVEAEQRRIVRVIL